MAVYGEPISVKVIRSPDGVITAKAWGHSRPNEDIIDLMDVLKVDVPVNELEDFILEIRCPIIIREMFFTIRDHVAWARTSRVDNLNDWPVHPLWQDEQLVIKAHAQMLEARLSGLQDHFRLLLPLCYITGFTIKLSARTLMRFCAALDRLASSMSQLESSPFWEMSRELKRAIDYTPYGKLKIDHYGAMELLPKYTHASNGGFSGHFVIVDVPQVPIALRAQVTRHRPVLMFDTLHRYLNYYDMCKPINSLVDMQLMMTREVAFSMVRKRNCWIAQEDLWSPIIQRLNTLFETEYEQVGVPLPCDTCISCPVGRDNMLRQEGKDPAPPCPIWLSQEGIEPSAEQRVEILRYMQHRPITNHFWQQAYLQYTPDQGA